MPDIVLTTFNARYHHAAFGLRYLQSNLGELQSRSEIVEFVINSNELDAIEQVLALNPKIVGISTYIWNVENVARFVAALKRIHPEIVLVVGGPEVSYELETQPLVHDVDYVITGEGDHAFRELCVSVLSDRRPPLKVITSALPTFEQLNLPYELYSDADIAHRTIYVEASRGCPFRCEFCLSSLDIPVRQVEVERFLGAMQRLLDRGARQFKFIDRTFNLNARVSTRILEFFLERMESGLFLHFEMVPDRLPDGLRGIIRKFPPGSLQFEIGIQTLNEEVAARIQRKQDYDKLKDNLKFLRSETGVHIHADLIVGLPGEDIASFGRGFDELVKMDPQEIQVGILKRLRGTPIIRHDDEWQMKYSSAPPYEILSNRSMSFDELQSMRRFSKYWDLIANSGNFQESKKEILHGDSAFIAFFHFANWLRQRDVGTHSIALAKLIELVFEYLVKYRHLDREQAAQMIFRDYSRSGRRDRPICLRPYLAAMESAHGQDVSSGLPSRQRRHISNNPSANIPAVD
jgi:radical SAM superfamily enzyme YgiQ (UPF0313 family)